MPYCCSHVRIRRQESDRQSHAAGADVHSAADFLCAAVLRGTDRRRADEILPEGYGFPELYNTGKELTVIPGNRRGDFPGKTADLPGAGHWSADRAAGAVGNLRHPEALES